MASIAGSFRSSGAGFGKAVSAFAAGPEDGGDTVLVGPTGLGPAGLFCNGLARVRANPVAGVSSAAVGGEGLSAVWGG